MAKEKPAEQTKVWLLPIEKITPSPFQARTVFDEGEIKKLAVSILQNGLLQPISVRPTVDGRYQLIAGERRLRACKLTGMETIPAIIYHFEDEKTAALSLLENLQREQLGPFEQARALRDLLNLWNCTQEAGARRLGIAQPTLANKLRLLTLTQEQQDICTEANLRNAMHGRCFGCRLQSCAQRRFAQQQSGVIMYSRPRRWWSGSFLTNQNRSAVLWCGMCVFL